MSQEPKIADSVEVEIMRSHDYCHFGVTLGITTPVTQTQVDELGKTAQRLVDKRVQQYKTARADESKREALRIRTRRLQQVMERINTIKPEFHTDEDREIVKNYQQLQNALALGKYDYQDDYWFNEEEKGEDLPF